jgi:DNA mismatch repair protein MutH
MALQLRLAIDGAPAPPRGLDELLVRARALDGVRLAELAHAVGRSLAGEQTRFKGGVGELVERALGASAGNADLPDFPQLGVELKTIPLDPAGRVRESTFVCTLDLRAVEREEWEGSRVRRKLGCVLWVPVEARSGRPLAERRLGTPRLWRPSPEEERVLRQDWTMLVGRIAAGGIDEVTGHLGQALQLRPKARNARPGVLARGPDGEALTTVRRGFYLRARFTEAILWA